MTTPTPTVSAELPEALRLKAEQACAQANGSDWNYMYSGHQEAQIAAWIDGHTAAQIEALSAAQARVPALSPTEQKWVLRSPVAIAQLLTFIDIDFSQGESAGMDMGNWPPKRYTELKEIGRKLIEQDPECFDESTLREFGFAPQPSPSPAPADQMAAFTETMLKIYGNEFPDQGEFAGDHGWSDHWAIFRAGVASAVLPAPAQPGQEGQDGEMTKYQKTREVLERLQQQEDGHNLNPFRPLLEKLMANKGSYTVTEIGQLKCVLDGFYGAARAAPQPVTADAARLFEATRNIADDYMTSETHHPDWVLIPTKRFDAIVSALAAQREVKP